MGIIQDYYPKHTNPPLNHYNPIPYKDRQGRQGRKENDYTYSPDILNPDHTRYLYYATQ